MSLPAEVLPQLLHSSALSGQPEAQRGLWMLCKGTGGNSDVRVHVRAAARMLCTLTTWQATCHQA